MVDVVTIAGGVYEVTDLGNGLVQLKRPTGETSVIRKFDLDFMISHSPPSGLEGMGLQWTPELGLTLKGGREATMAPLTVGDLYRKKSKDRGKKESA
jgi:hypothetical protein